MDFPIQSLMDEEKVQAWVLDHFHPQGLCCPKCQASVAEARKFRKTETSGLQVYRCKHCESIYNLYTGTVFAGTQFRPSQVVLLLRGVCQGVSSAQLGRELGLSRQTVLSIRRKLQTSAEQIQPEAALPDAEVETDEMFQNAGEKGDKHVDASDPPRRRGNKRRGHGTYDNDRPPIVGTKGRESGLLRLRVVRHTDSATFISGRCRLQRCIRMVGAAITVFSAPVKLFSIRMASGQETQTVMVFTRSIQIRLKVPGRRCETSFVPFVAFIKSSSPVTSQSVSSS